MSNNTDLAHIIRSSVTVTGSGNATVALADYGKTFYMTLGTYGILTLPDPTTQTTGWYIDVYAAGNPATYQGAYITHAGTLGSKFLYRRNATNTFILVGAGEGFRITFYNGVYNVNCIMQPQGLIQGYRTYTGSGAYNSTTATVWVEGPLNTFSGGTQFTNTVSSTRLNVGAAGLYQITTQMTLYAQGGAATGGFAIAINGNLVLYDYIAMFSAQSRTNQMTYVAQLVPGDGVSTDYYTSTSTCWYYPDNDYVKVELLDR